MRCKKLDYAERVVVYVQGVDAPGVAVQFGLGILIVSMEKLEDI